MIRAQMIKGVLGLQQFLPQVAGFSAFGSPRGIRCLRNRRPGVL